MKTTLTLKPRHFEPVVPPPVEQTGNYRALDRPIRRGARTPIMWPPMAAIR